MLTVLKALSDPIRLRLLAVLNHGELTVQDLTAILRLGQSRISHHLKVLCAARLLSVKAQGTWKYYRIEPRGDFLQAIWPQVTPRLAALPEHAADRQALQQLLAARRQQSLTFFEAHARQWDERARTLLPTPAYTAELLDLIPAGAALVELGTGTGVLLPELAARSRRLIGIDHSAAMLAEAGQRMARAGLSCDLRLGELRHLPLADAEMDCALLNMVLHHAEQPPEVLREVARILAPGGRIVIADLLPHRDDAVRQTMADLWLGLVRDDLVSWLQAAGFSHIDYRQKPASVDAYGIFLLTADKVIGV